MAYGLTTRMYLESEPRRPRNNAEQGSSIWRQLRTDERLKTVEQQLKSAA